jgi:cholesterol oxidase
MIRLSYFDLNVKLEEKRESPSRLSIFTPYLLINTFLMIYDYIVIGSGFGGSVASLRLVEKGYKVLLLEQGKRYNPEDFPKTNWNIPKYLWVPSLRCFGFQKLSFYSTASIMSGTGVGGGSLVYANTLYIPPDEFRRLEKNPWALLRPGFIHAWKKEILKAEY